MPKEQRHHGPSAGAGQPGGGSRLLSPSASLRDPVTPCQHGGGSGLGASRSGEQVVMGRGHQGQGRRRAQKPEGRLGAGAARTGSVEKARVPLA